jgi:hypothetical protein
MLELRVTGDGHRGLGHSGVGRSAIGHRLLVPAADLSIQSSTQSSTQPSIQPSFSNTPPSQLSGLRFPFEMLDLWSTGPLSLRASQFPRCLSQPPTANRHYLLWVGSALRADLAASASGLQMANALGRYAVPTLPRDTADQGWSALPRDTPANYPVSGFPLRCWISGQLGL